MVGIKEHWIYAKRPSSALEFYKKLWKELWGSNHIINLQSNIYYIKTCHNCVYIHVVSKEERLGKHQN